MALIDCPECKQQISDKASSCPNCGVQIQANSTAPPIHKSSAEPDLFAVKFFAFIVVGAIITAIFHATGITSWLHGMCVSFSRNISLDVYRLVARHGYLVLNIAVFFGWGDVGIWLVKKLYGEATEEKQ